MWHLIYESSVGNEGHCRGKFLYPNSLAGSQQLPAGNKATLTLMAPEISLDFINRFALHQVGNHVVHFGGQLENSKAS